MVSSFWADLFLDNNPSANEFSLLASRQCNLLRPCEPGSTLAWIGAILPIHIRLGYDPSHQHSSEVNQ
jgi:hypothetical protein